MPVLLFDWPVWQNFSVFSVLDIAIVAIIIFVFLRVVRGTPATNIIIAIGICVLLYFFAKQFDMPLLRLVFSTIISTGLIGIVVVFQPEIRKFLINFGKHSPIGKNGFITKFLKSGTMVHPDGKEDIAEQIGKCLVYCVANKIGALLVLQATDADGQEMEGGIRIEGRVSSKLLESIFEKQSPLHDGAVVIQGGTIMAAKVVLPVSDNKNLPVRLGLRHRAAIGVTEHQDVLAIIVSEEKNTISYALEGLLYENQTLDAVKKRVMEMV